MLVNSIYFANCRSPDINEIIRACEAELFKHKILINLHQVLKNCFFQSELDMACLARNIALSERQIYRFFKEQLNTTPSRFLNKYRLEKSLRLINKNNSTFGVTLGDISFDAGFSSQSYFCRCFKDYFGVTPSENIIGWQNIAKDKNQLMLS